MKAVVYKGPFDVAVENVADPRIEGPLDDPDYHGEHLRLRPAPV